MDLILPLRLLIHINIVKIQEFFKMLNVLV